MTASYEFTAALWEWDAKPGYFLVSLPEAQADEIDDRFGQSAAGFGSIRVEVTIGESRWRTSLFPSTDEQTYVLPIKKAIRTAEGIDLGDNASVELRVLID